MNLYFIEKQMEERHKTLEDEAMTIFLLSGSRNQTSRIKQILTRIRLFIISVNMKLKSVPLRLNAG